MVDFLGVMNYIVNNQKLDYHSSDIKGLEFSKLLCKSAF
jgi:hypothetical protein